MDREPTPEQRTQLATAGTAAGMGCAIAATIVLMVIGGVLLDQWLDTTPVFILIGVALGLAGAGYQLWELAQLSSKQARVGPVAEQQADGAQHNGFAGSGFARNNVQQRRRAQLQLLNQRVILNS